MPLINDRFYMNPAYGRAVEAARAAEDASDQAQPNPQKQSAHWVTIDGRHVLIQAVQAERPRPLSARDKAYLDKYYDAVASLAKVYNVDPALVLGVGIESSFGSQGTYLRTGDAFGMTGGSTKKMTTAVSPTENVKQFFQNYGNQIRGAGDDDSAFLNALQGLDASGKRVQGWKVYDTANPNWSDFIGRGIGQMRRDIPTYLSQRKVGPAPQ